MRRKRILLLSLKAGSGHIRAAEAVREALEIQKPDCEVQHFEVLEYMSGFFRWSFNTIYSTMIHRTPSLWRMLYERTEHQTSRFTKSLFGAWNRLNARRLLKEIEAFDPDCIVCTHFIPAEILAALRRRNKLRARLCVVMTDFDIHAAWVHRGVDQYCVATTEMEQSIQSLVSSNKHPEQKSAKVRATGIPIFAAFGLEYPQQAQMRKQRSLYFNLDHDTHLRLNPVLPMILLLGGGCGLGSLSQISERILSHLPNTQIVAVAGTNQKTYIELRKLAYYSGGKLIPLGFIKNMHELLAACDLAITKPGGLTSSECLAMGVPMILTDPIPGQEERNSNFLLESGAALRAQHLPSLIHKIGDLLSNRARLSLMSRRGKAEGKPAAALDVARIALGLADDAVLAAIHKTAAHLDSQPPKVLTRGRCEQGGHGLDQRIPAGLTGLDECPDPKKLLECVD
jgi:processive 1,2-diacylglycerol beta-glucosyltransferase